MKSITHWLGVLPARQRASTSPRRPLQTDKTRFHILWGITAVVFVVLALGAFYRQIIQHSFLQDKADNMILNTATLESHRGMILDRYSTALAVSTPLSTLWFDPYEYLTERAKYIKLRQDAQANPRSARLQRQLKRASRITYNLDDLAVAAGLSRSDLDQALDRAQARMKLVEEQKASGKKPWGQYRYAVLKRQVQPSSAEVIMARHFPAVYSKNEYQRYYPQAQPNAQLIGITNINNHGLEGLERLADSTLAGQDGKMRVMHDKQGNRIKEVELIAPEKPGKNLNLSIDSRLQYIMYRELAAGGIANNARSATAVALDAKTGEILAMTSWPAFNPNDTENGLDNKNNMRNRAVVDSFEPGSTMKPLTIAAALETGKLTPHTLINTNPGSLQIGNHIIRDHGNNGVIDPEHVIIKSSNVGAAKIALSLPNNTLPSFYKRLGIGQKTAIRFPGESAGLILPPSKWNTTEVATMSYGYGLNTTVLQLAQAYNVLAAGGVFRPVTLYRQDTQPAGTRLLDERIARSVVGMMEGVVKAGGTAPQAAIPGYRVAGKTGTARKLRADGQGYSQTEYRALFVGTAPATDPRLVVAVVVENPVGQYYGGLVAAPIFQRIMSEGLRLNNVPMDQPLTPAHGASASHKAHP